MTTFRVYLRMAWRNVRRNRRRTLITLSAVGMGLALIILWRSLMEGAYGDILVSVIRLQTSHLQVRAIEDETRKLTFPYLPEEQADRIEAVLRANPGVVAAAQRFSGGGTIVTSRAWANVSVLGIDPTNEPQINSVVYRASPTYLAPADRSEALIGKPLAEKLGVGPGDTVDITVPRVTGGSATAQLRVKGVYNTGFAEYDRVNVFIPLDEAQRLWQARGATEVVAMLKSDQLAPALAQALRSPSGAASLRGGASDRPYQVLDWMEANAALMEMFRTKDAIMVMATGIIVTIAIFGVLNTMQMSVFERVREIGVMLAMGLRPGEVRLLFALEGMIIGLLGAAAGGSVGTVAVAILSRTGVAFKGTSSLVTIPMGDVMYPQFVPVDAAISALIVVVACLLAAIYPAYSASRLEPAQALRYT